MKLTRLPSLTLLAALAAPAAGCVIEARHDPPPPHSAGTLTVAYTIDGTIDPFLCSDFGVTDAELVIYTRRGDFVTEQYAPCDYFEISAALLPGSYTADLTLVDAVDRARSITKPLYDLEVFSDTELVVDVDFPVGSML
ncbi:hypothetical protein [Sorangium sp. So ce1335]|uniref:hypothetical protein n=1 Tax=Sorangium sp. So ce1335 TaxID=3133335 RepID=UPI003F5ED06C